MQIKKFLMIAYIAITINPLDAAKTVDWQSKYKKKESDQTSKRPITDAVISAQRFKSIVAKAAAKPGIMAQFKNNPKKFLFGASSSSYQYEGGLDENNAVAQWCIKKGFKPAADAIDFWNRYENDIKQMKQELGINSFRISISWDRVKPTLEGNWDDAAINTYVKIISTLNANGIKPIVVLHHYTIPTWFAKIGGFEKKENLTHFIEYAQKMYMALHEQVTYWSTFNAIEGYAFKGYFTLDGPPGIKKSYKLTQQVMAHMLEAHVKVYQAIKGHKGLYKQQHTANPSIPEPQIGIQKNIVLLDPHPQSWFFTRKLTEFLMYIGGTPLQNKGFFGFFTTGTFYVPGLVTHKNLLAKKSLDWIGINIYSNIFMAGTTRQQETNEDKQTENKNYRDYPEGIYRAVKIINDHIARPLNIPIIVIENGIATTNTDTGNTKRTRFFQRALYTIRELIKEGYPIIGYTPWASHDNYEWPSKDQPNPYDRPYGMFKVNFDKKSSHYLERTLKKGAYYYRDFIQEYFR